eukprot:95601_1
MFRSCFVPVLRNSKLPKRYGGIRCFTSNVTLRTKFISTTVMAGVIGGAGAYWFLISDRNKSPNDNLPPLIEPFVDITPINTGTLELNESFTIANGRDIQHEMTCLSYLIEHPTHGPSLFDLGLSKELSKPNYGSLSKHAEFLNSFNLKFKSDFKSLSQFIETHCNYKPTEIKNLIVSHFHWDHVGDADDFPNAPLIMGKGVNKIRNDVCIACCRTHRGFFGFELPKNKQIIEVEWDDNCAIGPFSKCMDLYGDGSVFIVDGDGHVPGHIMAVAKHKKGWVLLAGDGVYDVDSYTGDKPVGKGTRAGDTPVDQDPEKGFETLCKIHEFYHMKNTLVWQAHFRMNELDSIHCDLKHAQTMNI